MMLASEEACRDQSPTGGWQDKTYIWQELAWGHSDPDAPVCTKRPLYTLLYIAQAMLSCGRGDVEHVPLS